MLTGKPTGKRPLGRPRRRRAGNIKVHFKKIVVNTKNRIDSVQNMDYWRALLNAAFNLRVP